MGEWHPLIVKSISCNTESGTGSISHLWSETLMKFQKSELQDPIINFSLGIMINRYVQLSQQSNDSEYYKIDILWVSPCLVLDWNFLPKWMMLCCCVQMVKGEMFLQHRYSLQRETSAGLNPGKALWSQYLQVLPLIFSHQTGSLISMPVSERLV